MTKQKRTLVGTGFLAALPLCALILAAGCTKSQDTTAGPPPGAPMGGPGGMPGRGQRGGGRGALVAANASGAEIYQAKCQGCHGDHGQGARGPSLARSVGLPLPALTKIVHDGRGRMPAFADQLTDAQITKVAASVKQLKPGG